MEHENHYASNGKGNLGVTLGAIGTGLGILGGNGLGGILGNGNCGCSEDHMVNRYELGLQQEISAKDNRIALLESNIYTDAKISDVYERLNTKFEARCNSIEAELCSNRVFNATTTAALNCTNGLVNELMALTSRVIPKSSICPSVMPEFNSWVAPTAPATGA